MKLQETTRWTRQEGTSCVNNIINYDEYSTSTIGIESFAYSTSINVTENPAYSTSVNVMFLRTLDVILWESLLINFP